MSLHRVATAVAALAIAFTASTTTAYALWSTTGSATFTVTLHTPPATAPDAPTGLACTLKPTGADVRFSWSGPHNATYRVYRVGDSAPLTTASSTQTAWVTSGDFGAPNADQKYRVVVRTVVGGVESVDSAVLRFDFQPNGCG